MNDMDESREEYTQSPSLRDVAAVIDAIPLPATLIDRQGVIVAINQAFVAYARSHGFPVRMEDRIGQPLTTFATIEESRIQLEELLHALWSEGKPQHLSWRTVDAPGNRLFIEIHADVLKDADGQLAGGLILRKDETESVRQEQRQQAVSRVRDRVLKMRSSEDIEGMLIAVRTALQELEVPFEYCRVNLVDETTKPPSVLSHNMTRKGSWSRGELGMPGISLILRFWRDQALAYRRDLKNDDPDGELRYLGKEPGAPIRSVVDVPFSQGTLAVSSKTPNAFSPEAVQALKEIAQVLSEGLTRMADLHALERRAQESESLASAISVVASTHELDEVFHTVVREATRLMSVGRASLFLFDEEAGVLVPRAQVGHDWETYRNVRLLPGEDISGYVFATGESYLIESEDQTTPARRPETTALLEQAVQNKRLYGGAAVPLRLEGNVIGTLSVGTARRQLVFGDLEMLERLGEEAVLAIDRMRRSEALEQRNQELEREIRERMQAQEALLESEASYRSLFEESRDPIFITSREGRFVDVNPSMLALFGYAREEMIDLDVLDIYADPADRDRFQQEIEQQGSVRDYEMKVRKKDGTEMFCLLTAAVRRTSYGRILGYQGILRDITERRQAEKNLQLDLALQRLRNAVLQMQNEQDWEQIVAAFQDELHALVDFHACSINIVDLKKDACTLYYTTPQGLQHIETPGIRPALRQAMDTGKYVYRSIRAEIDRFDDMVDKWDQEILSVVDVPFVAGTIAINSTREEEFGGEDIGILEKFAQVISQAHRRLEDLQALAATEEQFRQAQKMEAIGQLAGGMAHDFNNVLTAISGYSELMLTDADPPASQRADLEGIQEAVNRGATLVRQLLAFSRRHPLNPEVLNLNTVIADLEKMLYRLLGEDVELVTKLDPALEQVLVDEGQIQQILMNLAVNARDAMPEGGRLTIETTNVQLDWTRTPQFLDLEPGSYAMLAVSDTGEGMDTSTQERIFEPFFTTKEPDRGTGLGLSMVYGIVKQSRGDIQVRSAPGQGTSFAIYLPRVDTLPGEEEEGQTPSLPQRGRETVLVAEDDAGVRWVVSRILCRQGYTVLEAGTGEEALRLLQRHAGDVHLLVADVIMPGMSGRELAETLAALHPEVKVLFISGYAEGIVDSRGMVDPGTTLLQKPIHHDTLTRTVRELLDAS